MSRRTYATLDPPRGIGWFDDATEGVSAFRVMPPADWPRVLRYWAIWTPTLYRLRPGLWILEDPTGRHRQIDMAAVAAWFEANNVYLIRVSIGPWKDGDPDPWILYCGLPDVLIEDIATAGRASPSPLDPIESVRGCTDVRGQEILTSLRALSAVFGGGRDGLLPERLKEEGSLGSIRREGESSRQRLYVTLGPLATPEHREKLMQAGRNKRNGRRPGP